MAAPPRIYYESLRVKDLLDEDGNPIGGGGGGGGGGGDSLWELEENNVDDPAADADIKILVPKGAEDAHLLFPAPAIGTEDLVGNFIMFDVEKGAFRVGQTKDAAWNFDNRGSHSAVVGGVKCIANSVGSATLGGLNSHIVNFSPQSVIVGGEDGKIADSHQSVILGGFNCEIKSSTLSTILEGANNSINGSHLITILGGERNSVSGDAENCIVGGFHVITTHNNTFTWGDGTGDSNATIYSAEASGSNQFMVRASGQQAADANNPDISGVIFYSSPAEDVDGVGADPGVELERLSSDWSSLYDQNAMVFAGADPAVVDQLDKETTLENLKEVPIYEFKYKGQSGGTDPVTITRIGPLAQDWYDDAKGGFHAAGRNQTRIGTMDMLGVALASIQALDDKIGAGAGGGSLWENVENNNDGTDTLEIIRPEGTVGRHLVFPAEAAGTEGAGTRLMYDFAKGAFRVGTAGADSWNDINRGDNSAVVGGGDNSAAGLASAVVGGQNNNLYPNGGHSVILGGELNAIGDVGGGAGDLYAAVLAGQSNTAEGADSVVMGNSCGTADGAIQSFAGGLWARANHPGSFVWGDGTNTIDEPLITPGGNQFLVRASGVQGDLTHSGVRFLSTPAAAGNVEPGVELERWASDWSSLYDQNAMVFDGADPAVGDKYVGALENLKKVPIYEFKYKGQSGGTDLVDITRIGPLAQDWYDVAKGGFHAAGRNPSRIGTMDLTGVALAAIRELEEEVAWGLEDNNLADSTVQILAPKGETDAHLVFPAGVVGTEGAGTRLMYDFAKGAFRVGTAGADSWNDINRGNNSAVVGGSTNSATDGNSAVVGGSTNSATGINSAVIGGINNGANGLGSVIAGGDGNTAGGLSSAVVGGQGNILYPNGGYSVILGGDVNVIGDVDGGAGDLYAAVLAGQNNIAEGADSVVMGNSCSTADGAIQSFAGGRRAHANHPGSFVWGDGTNTVIETLSTTGRNQFIVRASASAEDTESHSGVVFLSTPAAADNVEPGVELERWASDWSSLYNKDAMAFDGTGPAEADKYIGALENLKKVPIYKFKYKGQSGAEVGELDIARIGPLAQDWYDAAKGSFPADSRNQSRIGTMDMLGVALASIRELDDKIGAGGGSLWENVENNNDGTDNLEIIRPEGNVGRHLVFPAGAAGTEGAGTRLMYDFDKGAFRVGKAGVDSWNDGNRGNNSAVIGGENNRTSGLNSAIAGGSNNTAINLNSAVVGGSNNIAEGPLSAVVGGDNNLAASLASAVVGGSNNIAEGLLSAVVGGDSNFAASLQSAVVGGQNNNLYPNGGHSVILGGDSNVIGDVDSVTGDLYAAVLAGQNNLAEGADSVVMGNSCGTADGAIQSFAGGLWARANHPGSFVWGDGTNTETDTLITSGGNQFLVRASGVQGDLTHSGVRFLSTPAAADNVEPGVELERWASDWSSLYSKDAMVFTGENLAEVDKYIGALENLKKVPIYEFKYKGQSDGVGEPDITRIGPLAQDWYDVAKGGFHAAGRNQTRIGTMDMLGVALASIRELEEEVAWGLEDNNLASSTVQILAPKGETDAHLVFPAAVAGTEIANNFAEENDFEAKMFYDATKHAFRLGRLSHTGTGFAGNSQEWNDDNRGNHSIILGGNSRASAEESIIIGYGDQNRIAGNNPGSVILGGRGARIGEDGAITGSNSTIVGGIDEDLIVVSDGSGMLFSRWITTWTNIIRNTSQCSLVSSGDSVIDSATRSSIVGSRGCRIGPAVTDLTKNKVVDCLIVGGNDSIIDKPGDDLANSIVLGSKVNCTHSGTFAWSSPGTADYATGYDNEFRVRATGGVRFHSDDAGNSGVDLAPLGNSWDSLCDRNSKENFVELDGGEILAKLEGLPVYQFNYKGQDPGLVNRGPVAQDWHAIFPSEGKNPLRIGTLDIDGITLAAVKGLSDRTKAQEAQIAELREKNAAQEAQIAGLGARLAALEELLLAPRL